MDFMADAGADALMPRHETWETGVKAQVPAPNISNCSLKAAQMWLPASFFLTQAAGAGGVHCSAALGMFFIKPAYYITQPLET